MNDSIRLISWFGTPKVKSLKIKPSCQTLLNIFSTSNKAAIFCCFVSPIEAIRNFVNNVD